MCLFEVLFGCIFKINCFSLKEILVIDYKEMCGDKSILYWWMKRDNGIY